MRVARLAVPLVAALLAACDAGAAITMKLNAEISIEHQVAVSLALGVLNSGDEMAREVEPEVIYLGALTRGPAIATLPQGERHDWTFDLPAPRDRGTFPIAIRVRYADINGYPLSALLVDDVRTRGATDGPVRSQFSADDLRGFSNARLVLENRGRDSVSGHVAVVLPAEFRTDEHRMPTDVPGRAQVEVPFVVRNDGALVGSSHTIYAFFEYDLDGIHHTVGRGAIVHVVSLKPTPRWPFLVGGAALAAAAMIGLALAWRRAMRRVPAPEPPPSRARRKRRRR